MLIIDTSILTLIQMALTEDLGAAGDVTSLATLPTNRMVTGYVRAKADGIIAGLPLIAEVYRQLDPNVQIKLLAQDSHKVTPGQVVAEVYGESRSVLAGERVSLNFLQRLSGVATLTAQFVEAVKDTNAIILDTRKTTPGWRMLEKYAVRIGGGQNHRVGLYDMVLIKDNHIEAAGGVLAAIKAAQANPLTAQLPIEVEVKNEQELREALEFDLTRVLLDNMTLDQMRSAVNITAGRVPLEASGNMSLERIRAVAETGVDYISVGALTHSAPALDLSMKISKITG
jgi:nicotinate-nucleotide pyrophosphorylase (carboxylating)